MTTTRRIAAILAAATITLTLTPTSAGAIPPPADTFGNLPHGIKGSTHARQFAQMDQATRLIWDSRKGDEIYIGMYSNGSAGVKKGLLSADRRGVRVVYVTFQNKAHPLGSKYKGDLRKLGRTKGSRFVACWESCGGTGDTMHLKVGAFKIRGRYWWMGGGGNLTRSSAVEQWNQWTWAQSKPLYDQAKGKVLRMATGRRDTTCTNVTDKKLGLTVRYYPCAKANPMLDTLKATRIRKGDRVWLDMMQLGPSATPEVRELCRLKRAGGDVRIIGHWSHWSKRRLAEVRKCRIPTRTLTSGDPNGDRYRYLHDKGLIVRAHDAKGHRYERALSGSYDLGVVSRRDNDNFTLTQYGRRITNRMMGRYDLMWRNGR